jgi:hypothetical protein
MKNLAFKVVGNVLVSVYTDKPPSDDEAAAILAEMKKLDLNQTRAFIVTSGGAPTTAQRKRVYDMLGPVELTAAVLSDSRLVRSVATAMAWFNKNLKIFSPHELDDALAFLGVPPNQFPLFRREVEKLQAELRR